MIDTPSVDWLALSPTLALLGASGIALLAAVLLPPWLRKTVAAVAVFAGFVVAAVFAGILFDESPEAETLLSESMIRDQLGAVAQLILAITGAVVVFASWSEKRRDNGEYYALLAAAGAGMLFFVQAENLMTLFLGLEWFSLCLYILVAFDTDRETSLEAGLKYVIVGGFGSAVLLFGSALVFGATEALGFEQIAAAEAGDDAFLVAGLAMILAGLAFKVSAAPFHMWTPDVYQGAPTSVTAFMSAATKTAALVVTLRILVTAFPDESEIWTIAVAVIACISLAWGNLAALAQRDVKRILAFSSISHAGFMLIAIAAGSERGAEALLYYLVPYSAMSVGAFAVVAARERELGLPVNLERLAGLGWERPFYGAALWIFMLGMAGLPAHRRLLREALRVLRGVRGRRLVARARRRRRDRALARVLPEHRALAVHALGRRAAARARGRIAAARDRARGRRGRSGRRHRRLVLRRRADPRPRFRRGSALSF